MNAPRARLRGRSPPNGLTLINRPRGRENPEILRLTPKGNPLTDTQLTKPRRLDLPWTKPPLTANQRLHWAERSRTTRAVRDAAHILARAGHLPKGLDRVVVQLHYRPRVNRRIDTVNLFPTVKAAVDGLVDYGLVPDDSHDIVSTPEPKIHHASPGRPGALWITIHEPTTTQETR